MTPENSIEHVKNGVIPIESSSDVDGSTAGNVMVSSDFTAFERGSPIDPGSETPESLVRDLAKIPKIDPTVLNIMFARPDVVINVLQTIRKSKKFEVGIYCDCLEKIHQVDEIFLLGLVHDLFQLSQRDSQILLEYARKLARRKGSQQ